MAVLAVAGRAFALFDDGLDRVFGALQVLHDREAGQGGIGGTDLRGRIAAEERRLADMVGQHLQSVADAAIEVTDGAVVLGARHQPALGHRAVIFGGRHELLAVPQVVALGPLEENEMIEHGAREAGQFDDHAGRMIAGRDRKVRPRKMRCGADRDEQIARQRQVGHLLDGDRGDRAGPALRGLGLRRREAIAFVALQAPGGVEIAAHQIVLDRRGFGEEVDQLLAGLDPDLGFFRHFPLAPSRRILTQGPRLCDSAPVA